MKKIYTYRITDLRESSCLLPRDIRANHYEHDTYKNTVVFWVDDDGRPVKILELPYYNVMVENLTVTEANPVI